MIDRFWDNWDYLAQGGWVMVPIALSSLLMWVFILERWITFGRLGGHDIEPADGLRMVDGGAVPTGVAGLRWRLVSGFAARRSGRAAADRLLLRAESERLRRELRRRLAAISVLAAVAPLLGLLGTVLGMIQTFEVIALFGTGNAKAMAGGISVALITTQSGLIVAIPGIFISRALSRRAGRLEAALDEFTLALDRRLRPDAAPRAMEASAS
ncbi:MAG TPA: MotA/TolQ/ExbB proton channel family protein [Candidatus Krumholzibacteria bacterium]|nr:MotA/TolQ/ExbB proton channel family protein [Candidatus Krumholzibacteria bacterium]